MPTGSYRRKDGQFYTALLEADQMGGQFPSGKTASTRTSHYAPIPSTTDQSEGPI